MVDHDKKITFDCDNLYVGNPLSKFTIWWTYNSPDVKKLSMVNMFFYTDYNSKRGESLKGPKYYWIKKLIEPFRIHPSDTV